MRLLDQFKKWCAENKENPANVHAYVRWLERRVVYYEESVKKMFEKYNVIVVAK